MINETKLAEILLVEDNPGDIVLTKEAFEDAKFRNNLHVAKDGNEALDYLFKKNGNEGATTPDIILLDLNLPDTDGKEVLAHIKNDDALKIIPTIILTSSQSDKDVIETYGMHANSYIVKPVDALKFMDVIKKIEDFWIDVVCLPKV